MSVDLTEIIVAVIGLLASFLTIVVTPWIRGKIGNVRWEQLQMIARVSVQAAEQLAANGKIDDKFAFAMNRVQKDLSAHHLSFDQETIRDAIESAVLEMGGNTSSVKKRDDVLSHTNTDAIGFSTDK